MRHFLFLTIIASLLLSCGGGAAKKQSDDAAAQNLAAETTQVMTLNELLEDADNYINKSVSVRGYITHTCKHSGKRCFLAGDDKKLTIRVEAKGKIGGFNRELIGSEVVIDGILKERRMSIAEINSMESDIKKQIIASDGSAEACDTETANVEMMRAWMKAHGKDYYSIYYMDGEDYHEL